MKTIEKISMVQHIDEDPEISYLQQYDINDKDPEIRKYAKQDKERLESLYAGNWEFIGIQAKAEIRINGISQVITSGGLWGIESDSGDEYFEEIYQEEKEDLKNSLLELGFDSKEIAQNEDLKI
tara:strand:+ start:206 stop:577 length:372 start_codon:yes stop_codon:yes gene_type:complete